MQFPQRITTINAGMVKLCWVNEEEEEMAQAAFVPRERHLHTFFVNKRFRGKGWGRRFLNEVETMMKRDGCEFVAIYLAPATSEDLGRIYQFFKDSGYFYTGSSRTLMDWIRYYLEMDERVRVDWMYKRL